MKTVLKLYCALCGAMLVMASACGQGTNGVSTLLPGAPAGIVAVAGNGSASLFWSPATAPATSPVTGYTVTAQPGGLTTTTMGATTASFGGLTDGATYVFTVHATNGHGNSPESPPSNPIVPAGPTAPGAPTAVVATAEDSAAVIQWAPPANDGGRAVTGYTVVSVPGGLRATSTGTTTATISGLTNGTTYVFTVQATNAVGSGPQSAPSNAVVPESSVATTVPGAPTAVVAAAGDGTANVVWAAPLANGGSMITGYTVTSTPGAFTATATEATMATVTGLANGTSYVFTVHATNAIGNSVESPPSNAVVPEPSVPGAPTAVVATATGDGTAALVWTPPLQIGGSAISSYTITSLPGNLTTTVSTTTATMTGLMDGTTYVFTVHATNAAGNGPESGQSNAITPEPSALSQTESSLSATPAAPFEGDATVLQLHLADEYGNPEVGWPARFVVDTPLASLTVTSGVTDAHGNFTSVLTMTGTGFVDVTAEAPQLTLQTLVTFSPLLACATTAPAFADQNTATGSYPSAIVEGDFNRDGKPDLIAANENASNVGVLLGNGDGTFQSRVTYATGTKSFPAGVTAADLNGDELLDLAVADTGTGNVGILLGNGDGTFRRQVTYSTETADAGSSPVSISVNDFNADGKPDLAVANNASSNVGVLLGNGDGTFQPQVTYAVGALPEQVVTGDFNGDGKIDIAAACRTTLTVALLFGNGDGTFQPQVYYTTGPKSYPVSLVAGDFNNDGKVDFAVADSGSSVVGVFLGLGNGKLKPQVSYSTGMTVYPANVVTGDFNGDGKPDLAVTNSGSSVLGILLGNGDGTFQTQVPFSTGSSSYPVPIAVGDLNGDGRVDLAVGNQSASNIGVFLNTCQ